MTDKIAVRTAAFGRAGGGPYAQAIAVPPGRGLLFTAGIIARDHEGTLVAPGDVELQGARAIFNLAALAEEAGATLDDVVKLTIYVCDIEHDLPAIMRLRDRHWPEHPPASTCVEVARLMTGDVRVELEAIVLLPGDAVYNRIQSSSEEV